LTSSRRGISACPPLLVGVGTRALLAGHDSYSFFWGIGDLVDTGPTLTNVNDIRTILIA